MTDQEKSELIQVGINKFMKPPKFQIGTYLGKIPTPLGSTSFGAWITGISITDGSNPHAIYETSHGWNNHGSNSNKLLTEKQVEDFLHKLNSSPS